jgi:hypothetical protein
MKTFDSIFWRQYRIANLVPKPEDASECPEGEKSLTTVGELQQIDELSPARIDFWQYPMRELEAMYRRLFGIMPVRKSKEQIVECLVTGRLY